MIRVLLAEDHETVREGLRMLIDAQTDMRVVGEAANGRQAIERTDVLKPDVVVLDLTMPEVSGVSAAQALTRQSAVVALTRHDDDAYVQELLGVGAKAYVLKQSASSELLRAIRVAASGG